MNTTSSANRKHIIILGACNSGKSSLINMLTTQEVSLVSKTPGTTTDPVRKSIEIPEIGPVVLIDTAGLDDNTILGISRIKLTERSLQSADIALLLVGENSCLEEEWKTILENRKIPYIELTNKIDENRIPEPGSIGISCLSGIGKEKVLDALKKKLISEEKEPDILRGLVERGDLVIMVMPQDTEAPKGRIILPQVHVLRALLDKGCVTICIQPEQLEFTLSTQAITPELVITDSQVFKFVENKIPKNIKLTSFSVLMAGWKGDMEYFIESAKKIDNLNENSKILIAESCSHVPLTEDIGRVKLPALLRKRKYESLQFEIASGNDFPEDLTPYDLILQCGGCMVNRQQIMSRISKAKQQDVPMSNYGIAVAYLSGIIDRISY